MYGNCFVFNFPMNEDSDSETVALPGPGYGLTLVLNLEQEDYGDITETAGARFSNIIMYLAELLLNPG